MTIRKCLLLSTHSEKQTVTKRQFCFNLWPGTLGQFLIVPCILLARVPGDECLNFILTHLRGLLETVSFITRLHMSFQHDSVSLHYSREVRQW
jgi:hypothetical protein